MRVLQLSFQLNQQTWPSGSPLTPVAKIIPLFQDFISLGNSWLNMKLPTYKENLVFFLTSVQSA